MRNILITGANGQLGNCLRDLAKEQQDKYHFFYTDVEELDITDAAAIDKYIVENQINIIINAAAYTAVDKAEDDEANAYRINCTAVANLANAAKKHGLFLIHVSTDYVFPGDACTPYVETDPTGPLSVYGSTKLAGERAIQESGCRAVIIRTSWLYSEYGNNFVKTMLRLGAERESLRVVCDQIGGPTYAGDLAKAIFGMLDHQPEDGRAEIYHFANEGVCSWFDFAKAIMELGGLGCRVEAIPSSDYPAKAHRPAFSVFNLGKIKSTLGVGIPYWRESLVLTINKLR
ncbi:MAG: dTDP-4-dehydrorhamnose reductase [Bacteroidales bacterium]|nr:dTDP-4-dehydrorhamnose reductase [Bacteroidales bacterium]